MSRTDRHRPHWVQAADPDERNGYWFAVWPSHGMRWTLLHRTCSCRWHSMYYTRTEENRRRRHDDQRRARAALKGHQTAWDER